MDLTPSSSAAQQARDADEDQRDEKAGSRSRALDPELGVLRDASRLLEQLPDARARRRCIDYLEARYAVCERHDVQTQ